MSELDLELVSTDDLIDELAKRWEGLIVLGTKDLGSNVQYQNRSVLRLQGGTVRCLGLLEDAKMRVFKGMPEEAGLLFDQKDFDGDDHDE